MAEKMSLKPFSIYEIKDLTVGEPDSSKIRSFRLRPIDGINYEFKPGMFSSLFLKPTDKLFRSYSIASSPKENYLELLIEMINGKFTSLLSSLREGDQVYVSEPRGTFIYEPDKIEKALFLAAGIGIAPFFSMLRYLRDINLTRDIVLFYSVKHKADIAYPEELKASSHFGTKLFFTVTRDPQDKEWKGGKGRINMKMVKSYVNDLQSRMVYICGGIKFVKDIVEELKNEGISDENIKRDIWGE